MTQEDLPEALAGDARTLVVGTGTAGRMRVPSETLEYLPSAGLEVVVKQTGEACETYNRLSEHGPVVAALDLAC